MDASKKSCIDKDNWKNFIRTFFDPWIIIFCLAVFFVIRWSVDEAIKIVTNNLLVSLLSVLISILSGILGAILFKRWTDLTESRVLAVRGKSAIRNLKMLLRNVTNLKERVTEFISSSKEGREHSKDVTMLFLENVVDKSAALQEETVNSIENWIDIIPEADIKTVMGDISELKGLLSKLQAEIVKKEGEIKALKEKEKKEAISKDEVIKKMSEIQAMNKDMQKYIREIKDKEKKIDINVPASGVGYTKLLGLLPDNWDKYFKTNFEGICKKCGSHYHYASAIPLDHDPGLCPKCQQAAGLDEKDNKK